MAKKEEKKEEKKSITQMIEEAKVVAGLMEYSEIQKFIFDCGSDSVSTFGGQDIDNSIQCQQVPEELAQCILALKDSGEAISSYLEVGAAAGGSVFLMDHFFKPTKIVLIDDNKHSKSHIRDYILRGITYTTIIGNSHDKATRMMAEAQKPYDAVMIDADHYYEGVRVDVDIYGEFVRPGGFLIIHDSKIGHPYGVERVATELKRDKGWEVVGEYVAKAGPVCGILLLKRWADASK